MLAKAVRSKPHTDSGCFFRIFSARSLLGPLGDDSLGKRQGYNRDVYMYGN